MYARALSGVKAGKDGVPHAVLVATADAMGLLEYGINEPRAPRPALATKATGAEKAAAVTSSATTSIGATPGKKEATVRIPDASGHV